MIAKALTNEREIFRKIALKVSDITGVQLGNRQESLVAARLSKHLRNLGGLTPAAYWQYLADNEATEISVLISLLTTHHTFFFREMDHFEFLARELGAAVKLAQQQGRKEIRIWSAACSTGEEVYSLAIFLEHHLRILKTDIGFRIFGSDVASSSVEAAKSGVFSNRDVMKIPQPFSGSDYWIRGRATAEGYSKIRGHLRARCDFRVVNLLKLKDLDQRSFDFVFCRNVFIYFQPEEVERVTSQLLARMNEGAFLFIGMSESLLGYRHPLDHVGKSIYRKTGSRPLDKLIVLPTEKPKASLHLPALSLLPSPRPEVLRTPARQTFADASCLIVIGASTGGTEALRKIISALPAQMPPILIVQHIPGGFSRDFARCLDDSSKLRVKEAVDGDAILPGTVYVAPGGKQMEVIGRGGTQRIAITHSDKVSGHCPSVDVLMESVAKHIKGKRLVGVILTGMGSDGAKGLLAMKEAGALTLGQDEASSVVYGMPKIARQMGAVAKVVSLQHMPQEIIQATRPKDHYS